jgi:hypothetical protein
MLLLFSHYYNIRFRSFMVSKVKEKPSQYYVSKLVCFYYYMLYNFTTLLAQHFHIEFTRFHHLLVLFFTQFYTSFWHGSKRAEKERKEALL